VLTSADSLCILCRLRRMYSRQLGLADFLEGAVHFLASATDEAQLDVCGAPWTPYYVKCPAACRVHVELPLSISSQHDDRRRSSARVFQNQEVRITAIRQSLIAEDEMRTLERKYLLGLIQRGTRDYLNRECFQGFGYRSAALEIGGDY
jgi:hypothetical protein